MAARKPRNTIGIIFSSIGEQFRDNFIDSLSSALLKKGYFSNICLTNGDIDIERKYIEQMTKTTDGIVLMSCARTYDELKDIMPKRIPVVFLFNQPDGCPETTILESDYSAIYQGVISIANKGKTKMAYVCSSFDQTFTQGSFKAYTDAFNVISPGYNTMDNVFTVDPNNFRPKTFLDKIKSDGYDSIFCATSTLTSSLIDTMLVYQAENNDFALSILGYSYTDKLYSSRLYANVIIPSYDEIINLTVQQVLYQISHPDATKRAFLLKGTLHTNQFTLN